MHRLSWLLLPLVLVAAPRAGRGEEARRPFPAAKSAFRRALRSKDPQQRAQAFAFFRDRPEVEAVGEILWGFQQVEKALEKLRKQQAAAQRTFDKKEAGIEKANEVFRASQRGPHDIDRYNKATRKLEKEIAAARRELARLEIAWTREQTLLDGATTTLASVFQALPEGALPDGLAFLRTFWLESEGRPAHYVRWMETLADVRRPAVTAELHRALDDGEAPMSLRVSALQALTRRRDGAAFGRALDFLKLSPASDMLIAAAIRSLRVYHDRRAIEPLIDFLVREDIHRLRGDAHEALKSLTGQQHGPYAEPWRAWWEEHGKTFQMPPDPVETEPGAEQKAAVTFYGIRTFSDRVLFIVDVSASMEWALGGRRGEPGGEQAKIVTARKELTGAVYNLPADGRFNVILFNHEVLPWQPTAVTATESNKRMCDRWIQKVKPTGLTNVHDALEAGFRLVLRTTGKPDFDTVFFLTDGKPTAGRVQKTSSILAQVRDWVAASQVQLHVVGIGGDKDIDEPFLMALSRIGHGKYVRRGG